MEHDFNYYYQYNIEHMPELFIEAISKQPLWIQLSLLLWALLAVGALVFFIVWVIRQKRRERELFDAVMSNQFIPAREFLDGWALMTSGRGRRVVSGLKLIDQPGCYVILTNMGTDENGNRTYDNVYVGQSVKACSRVRAHLTGHGNGDVYADVRNGENVSVCILPCPAEDMNDNEKALIAAFHATESYNVTHGGSRYRGE